MLASITFADFGRALQEPCTAETAPFVHPGHRIAGATPGCYSTVMDEADYHRSAGVSSTGLKQAIRSVAHYKAWLDGRGDDDTAARRFGRAVHTRLLEPHRWQARYAVWHGDDRRGGEYAAFAAARKNMDILLEREVVAIEGCAESLLASSDFPMEGFIKGARAADGTWVVKPAQCEMVIVWTDEETGLTCRVRLDAVSAKPCIALDVKTCGDARPRAFARDIARLHYDLQAAFYMEGVKRFFGADGPFVFAAVESLEPHASAFHVLPPDHDFRRNGVRKYRHALNGVAHAQATKIWPAYGFGRLVEPVMEPWMEFVAR